MSEQAPKPRKPNITAKKVEQADAKPFDPVEAIEGVVVNPEDIDDPLPDRPPAVGQLEDINTPLFQFNLNRRQERFCQAYIGKAGFIASKAAEFAGYRSENKNSLSATASQLLNKPHIQRRIAHLLAERRDGEWAHNRARELAGISMADFIDVDEKTGRVSVDLRKAKRNAAIGSIKKLKCKLLPAGEDGGAEVIDLQIELYDPQPSIALLLKMAGKFGPELLGEGPIVVKYVKAGLIEQLPPPKGSDPAPQLPQSPPVNGNGSNGHANGNGLKSHPEPIDDDDED
jgi:hypothetical protein